MIRAGLAVLVVAAGALLFARLILVKETETVSNEPVTAITEIQQPKARADEAPTPVAVLPFVAMSNGPDDDYFSDGLTEEIINAMAQLPGLLVIARTSAFHFKGQTIPIEDIARQLGVAYVVKGSMHRAGEQLRITAQLIRAEDGFHLWSETYDGRTPDTFTALEDIAEAVALALGVLLDDDLRTQMRRTSVGNAEAITAYQKGQELSDRAQGGVDLISLLRRANIHFEEAVELAPDFPDPYLHLSGFYSYILLSQANGEIDGQITADDVRGAPAHLRHHSDRAVRFAANAGQRSSAEHDRALVLGHWNGLSALTDRVLSSPGCEAGYWLQLTSAAFEKPEALFDTFARMAACDPLQPQAWVHMTGARLWLGDAQGALATAAAGLQSVHNEWLTRTYILALARTGRVTEAKQLINTQLRYDSERLIAKFMVAAAGGEASAALEYQQEFLSKHGPDDSLSLVMEASLGSRNEANRLAGLIDSRPFGYMSLMQAIYWCICGAPFDLEAAPVFSGMLSGSGLSWPPAKPLNFPLKDW